MSDNHRSDLAVEPISTALQGYTLDVVVSGSIGAVESVRFIRALRRLGAEVIPWLTAGGSRFVTEVAVGWAAGRPVRSEFSGDASHIATGDGCIVAPASANMMAKIALGITDSPASALVASYLGAGRPVAVVPNMHDSLALSPVVSSNLETARKAGVTILTSREEEGKRKFPDPAYLADQIAHLLRSRTFGPAGAPRVLVSLGTTRGYIDDVRYVSNYSSGALGSLVVEELHRLGLYTDVVAGPCPILPRVFGRLTHAQTNGEMARACHSAMADGASAAILAASVLDFAPSIRTAGKIKSAENTELTVTLVRQPKIIADVNPLSGIKVGFKLESGLTAQGADELARQYMAKYGLSLMVINDLADVDQSRHKAWVFGCHGESTGPTLLGVIGSKKSLAESIAQHVASRLSPRV